MNDFAQKFIEALFEVLAQTDWKDEGLEFLDNLPEDISNITLDKEKGLIEFEDVAGITTHRIEIRKVHVNKQEVTK